MLRNQVFNIVPDTEAALLNTPAPVSESFYYSPSFMNEFPISHPQTPIICIPNPSLATHSAPFPILSLIQFLLHFLMLLLNHDYLISIIMCNFVT
jgi:hypothetical protein